MTDELLEALSSTLSSSHALPAEEERRSKPSRQPGGPSFGGRHYSALVPEWDDVKLRQVGETPGPGAYSTTVKDKFTNTNIPVNERKVILLSHLLSSLPVISSLLPLFCSSLASPPLSSKLVQVKMFVDHHGVGSIQEHPSSGPAASFGSSKRFAIPNKDLFQLPGPAQYQLPSTLKVSSFLCHLPAYLSIKTNGAVAFGSAPQPPELEDTPGPGEYLGIEQSSAAKLPGG